MRHRDILATAAIATLVGFASLTSAGAIPIALPSAATALRDAYSAEASSPHASLIQHVGWHRHGWHHHDWHRHRWHGHWH
jgi:hypothetical protein